MLPFKTDQSLPLAQDFMRFVDNNEFPCVGAKAAMARGKLQTIVCRNLLSSWDDLRIYSGLYQLAQSYSKDPALFQSFAVLFEQPTDLSENEFETALWSRVQSLSEKDAAHGQSYDARVSQDPSDPHFSLSFGSQAFFVVGLNPHASRPARRFRTPALVFNLHDQFEQLREAGKYLGMRDKIIARDVAIAGSSNPMLAMHGEVSEAKQYSGRAVANDWKCPFRPEEREKFLDDRYSSEIRHGVPNEQGRSSHRR